MAQSNLFQRHKFFCTKNADVFIVLQGDFFFNLHFSILFQ